MTDTPEFQANVDVLLGNNADFVAGFDDADLQGQPIRNLAVVACMDSRVDPLQILGIQNGDAHMIRNAGGVVTDDVIRSLTLSQRFLSTREIILLHHTDCGLQKVNEDEFRNDLEAEIGVKPSWSLEGFADAHKDVAQSIKRLQMSPFLPHKDHISGFVYDVADGLLHKVEAPAAV